MDFIEIFYTAFIFTCGVTALNILFFKYIYKRPDVVANFSRPSSVISFFVFYSLFLGFSHYFFPSKKDALIEPEKTVTVVSGQAFSAPELEKIQTPLMTDIDFVQGSTKDPVLTTVTTKLAQYIFSSRGAVMTSMDFFWQEHSTQVTMLPCGTQSFQLALAGTTPIDYQLIDERYDESLAATILQYQTASTIGRITKKFIVYHESYQVDVTVAIDYHASAQPQAVRLFFPMPAQLDEACGVSNTLGSGDKIFIQNIALNKEKNFKQFWFEPKLFGIVSKFLTFVCFDGSSDATVRAYFKQSENSMYQVILESKPLQIGREASWSFYCGPKTPAALAHVKPYLKDLISYGWLSVLAKPLFQGLIFLQEKTGSYGWAILLLSLLLKLLLLPFTLRGERSLKKQAEFEKKRAYLQQKFKHDKAAFDAAQTELFAKHGMPMLSGCLPMLLNIPVLFALNKVLVSSIELHGASFLWLPDLSAADPLYILSILTGLAMIMTPSTTQGPRQMASRFGMALLFGAFTTYLASGLAMFIAFNTIFGVVQSYLINRVSWISARFA